jgi:hypothetical protein
MLGGEAYWVISGGAGRGEGRGHISAVRYDAGSVWITPGRLSAILEAWTRKRICGNAALSRMAPLDRRFDAEARRKCSRPSRGWSLRWVICGEEV